MLDATQLRDLLYTALSTGADFAEVFCERTHHNSILMISSKIENIGDTVSSGVGIRILKGTSSVYASTTDLSREGLIRCAKKVAQGLVGLPQNISINLTPVTHKYIHDVKIMPDNKSHKTDILKEAYFAARNYHESISQVSGSFVDTDRNILIANSEGLITEDRQIRSRLVISSVASKDGENQSGNCSPGAHAGLEYFQNPKHIGEEASRQAVTMLTAGYCPAGKMPVAIENGFGGVIFHEACGHSLEATSVGTNRSQFCGRLGTKIANEKVTAIDDGTIKNGWGSCNIDDEGSPTQKNILIENGILTNYLIDRLGSRRMGMASNGCARRQSYAYEPTSRMSNTYIANGPDKNSDIISSIDYGLYAKQMGGGSVNPVTGEFNFSVTEGYMIRGGKICEAVRGASLIGRGSDILMDIDMVGNNLERAQGMCGSSSGNVPVDVGQPLLRVSSITVGGR